MKTSPLILAALIGASSGFAYAQYTGPSGAKGAAPGAAAPSAVPSTVRALLASGKDDMVVNLQGRIVRHLGGEKYRFADSTGEITVEIETEQWPANTPIDDKAQVRLQGEFDKDLIGEPEIEVKNIEKLK
jgi:uncharacterized protein (TIGR00156 family)